ncbi:MAG: hypothetical protein AAB920_03745 [Patescibacteria group bacterium]
MKIKNPLYDQNGRFIWDKFFSYFGPVFCLLAFLVTGSLFESAIPSHVAFTYGGTIGFAIVAIMIYGFAGFGALCLMWFVSVWVDQWPLVFGVFFGGWVGIFFASKKTPPFHKTFVRWLREREGRRVV